MATDLHYAARSGDLAAVRAELDRGRPVDADAGGDFEDAGTPLTWAAGDRRAGRDVVELLLARGANPNAVAGDLHRTPLAGAAKTGGLAKVLALLAAGADAAYVDPTGYAALTLVSSGRGPDALAVASALVAAGAPLNAESDWGESPLSVASRVGRFDIVAALLDAGADPRPLAWTPLMRAAALGTPDDVAAALRRHSGGLTEADCWGRTPYLIAAHAGDAATARLLLDAGADPAARGRGGSTALILAAGAGRAEMLRWLLAGGAVPGEADDFGATALMAAAVWGEAGCARLLLAAGADPAAEDHVRTRAVTVAGTADVLRALADTGADLNYVDGCGDWPLKLAAQDGDSDRLEFLLAAGATVDRTSTGATALHEAVLRNEVAAVRRLLAAGAAVNVPDVDGCTPLHEARSAAIARMLMEAGADPGARNDPGRTAVEHHAGRPDILAVLRPGGDRV